MIRPSESLPDFKAPPVVETVLAVAYEPLAGMSNLKLCEVWIDLFRERFPQAEERPPYPAPIESFVAPAASGVSVSAGMGPPPTRLWMVTERGTELLQLQADWFARNWRKQGEGDAYPRYEKYIRPAFTAGIAQLREYVEQSGMGKVSPTQCEVTYVNHIRPAEFWRDHGDISRVFTVTDPSQYFPGRSESVAFRSTYLITDAEVGDAPLGRLHVQIDSGIAQDTREPIFILNLTARGAPLLSSDDEGILRFLDMGRRWIVNTFAEITTPAAHQAWGRTQ